MARPAIRRTTGEAAGAAMIIASASIWPLMDAIARHLGEAGVPVSQIAWGRYVGNGLLLLPIVLARWGWRALLPRWEPLHLVRAVIPAAIAIAFFLGLRYLPFASASALLFTNPLLITALSALFLGERVGPRRCFPCRRRGPRLAPLRCRPRRLARGHGGHRGNRDVARHPGLRAGRGIRPGPLPLRRARRRRRDRGRDLWREARPGSRHGDLAHPHSRPCSVVPAPPEGVDSAPRRPRRVSRAHERR